MIPETFLRWLMAMAIRKPFNAAPGHFLLVIESYMGRRRRIPFTTLDAAYARATKAWLNARPHTAKSADVYDDRGLKVPPSSYVNVRRPPINEAMELEAARLGNENITVLQAADSLIKHGYFTVPPRPWQIGYSDRGMGHGNYAVLDRFGDLIAAVSDHTIAQFIVAACNAHEPSVAQTGNPPDLALE